jgi:hypothetical protein
MFMLKVHLICMREIRRDLWSIVGVEEWNESSELGCCTYLVAQHEM